MRPSTARAAVVFWCCGLGVAHAFLHPRAPSPRWLPAAPQQIFHGGAARSERIQGEGDGARCWGLHSGRRRQGLSAVSRPVEAYMYNDTSSSTLWQGARSQPLGTITLVGAGPGDPELLTVAAVNALGTSETLVVADRLISPEILQLVRGELRIARKHPGCAEQAQQEIYDWVREAVMHGRDVVRLKIGDPFLFGRGGEEVLEYRKYGVEPKVIPGVSSAFAAPLLSSIAVTHRSVSNQVYICTGFGKDGDRPYLAPYYRNQTAVFLMAVGRLQELCDNLQKVGYPSDTPVAVVEKASTPQQRTLLGTIETITAVAAKYNAQPPAVIVVGDVVPVLLDPEQDMLAVGEELSGRHEMETKTVEPPVSRSPGAKTRIGGRRGQDAVVMAALAVGSGSSNSTVGTF